MVLGRFHQEFFISQLFHFKYAYSQIIEYTRHSFKIGDWDLNPKADNKSWQMEIGYINTYANHIKVKSIHTEVKAVLKLVKVVQMPIRLIYMF